MEQSWCTGIIHFRIALLFYWNTMNVYVLDFSAYKRFNNHPNTSVVLVTFGYDRSLYIIFVFRTFILSPLKLKFEFRIYSILLFLFLSWDYYSNNNIHYFLSFFSARFIIFPIIWYSHWPFKIQDKMLMLLMCTVLADFKMCLCFIAESYLYQQIPKNNDISHFPLTV